MHQCTHDTMQCPMHGCTMHNARCTILNAPALQCAMHQCHNAIHQCMHQCPNAQCSDAPMHAPMPNAHGTVHQRPCQQRNAQCTNATMQCTDAKRLCINAQCINASTMSFQARCALRAHGACHESTSCSACSVTKVPRIHFHSSAPETTAETASGKHPEP